MMRRAAPVAVAVLALVSATAGAQPPDRDAQYERFLLFTGCAPVYLVVEHDPDRSDFTTAVTAAAESRLRAARLFIERDLVTDEPMFYVNVNRVGTDDRGPFSLGTRLAKPVYDVATGLTYRADTWSRGSAGRGDDDFILNSLSRRLDQFLAAYLRVNEDACD